MADKKWYPNRKKRRFLKQKAMEYKGNACLLCGFDETNHQEAFDFHHMYPEKKTKNVSRLIASNRGWKRVKKELNKCVLLCAVCHRIIEAGRDKDGR